MKKIVIVGGGASGLMAGIMAARAGASVTVLERNDRPGKKLCATGNGRCNFTNLKIAEDSFRGTHPDFARPALTAFPPGKAVCFLEDLGILTVSREGLMYPRNMQASSVAAHLLSAFLTAGGKLKTRERVRKIEPGGKNGFQVLTETWHYDADALILACGSAASGIAGAGMDGYQLAESLGHHIIQPLPALTGLVCKGNHMAAWAGVRTQADVSLRIDGKRGKTVSGEVQLTDYGVSGIPVFDLSRFAIRAREEGCTVEICLDFLPEMSLEQLEALFVQSRERFPRKNVRELLAGWFPEKLAQKLSSLSGLPSCLKDYRIVVEGGLSLEHAQACSGGVDTEEVDPVTMESVLVPDLFFCGEILDIDGNCGGYNLQWAWASGQSAGIHAASGKDAVRERKEPDSQRIQGDEGK